MFLEKISSSKSKAFVFCLVIFIIGVALASALNLEWRGFLFIIIVLIFCAFCCFLHRQNLKYRLIFLGGIFICLGILRFIITVPKNAPDNLIFYHNRRVELKALVVSELGIKNGKQTIFVQAKELKINNLVDNHWQNVEGKIYISLSVFPEYYYGQTLNLDCDLVAPGGTTDSAKNFANYLKKEKAWSVCLDPRASLIGTDAGNFLQTGLYKIRWVLEKKVNDLLPEPQSSFLAGLLYGARTNLPEELTTAFNRTGTTHIIAISGYNITIVAAALVILLKAFGINRKKSFWMVSAGIIFFVIFSGASSSVVRAGVMGLVVLFSKQVGRSGAPARVLILTAFLMLLFNPRILFFDVGFQLSFLSTMGLIYLSPVLEKYFYFWPEKFGLKEIVLSTFSAIIFTTPLIIYVFGRFSLVAPIANLLILWVIPCTMALGAAALLASFVFFPFGQILAWVTWLPLTYIIKIVDGLSNFKWASIELPKMVLIFLGLIYLIFLRAIFKKTSAPQTVKLPGVNNEKI